MKRFDGLDCCEITLNTMFQAHNIDLRYTFFDKWNFYFDSTKELVGDALYSEDINRFRKYQSCLNLGISEQSFDDDTDIESLYASLSEQIADTTIIMAEVESYNYKYDKGYHKYRGTHFFSIVTCDSSGVWIIDSWYNQNHSFLSYMDLASCLKKIIIISTGDYIQPIVSIDLVVTSIISPSDLEKMKLLINRIPSLDLRAEFHNLSPQSSFLSPLDRSLRHIIMNRQRYMSFLRYTSETLEKSMLRFLSDDFNAIVSEWAALRSVILQSYFLRRKLDVHFSVNTLTDILNKEKLLRLKMEDTIW